MAASSPSSLRSSGSAPRAAHVSDHAKSDWLRPQLAGWAARWRPAPHAAPGGRSALGHALRALPCDAPDPLHATACDLLAPLLIAHTLAVAALCRRNNIGAVGYLARDCWLFERVADARRGGRRAPASRDVRLSRRSVTLAHPDRLLERDDGLPGKVGKATIGGRLGAFDLPEQLQEALLSASGLCRAAPATVENVRRFAGACKVHDTAVQSERLRQRELLRAAHRVMGEHERMPHRRRLGRYGAGRVVGLTGGHAYYRLDLGVNGRGSPTCRCPARRAGAGTSRAGGFRRRHGRGLPA